MLIIKPFQKKLKTCFKMIRDEKSFDSIKKEYETMIAKILAKYV